MTKKRVQGVSDIFTNEGPSQLLESVRDTDYTNATGSYTDVLSQGVTTGEGDRLLITVAGLAVGQEAVLLNGGGFSARLLVDGIEYQRGGAEGQDSFGLPLSGIAGAVSFSRLVTGLSAGTHTIKTQLLNQGDQVFTAGVWKLAMQIMVFPPE